MISSVGHDVKFVNIFSYFLKLYYYLVKDNKGSDLGLDNAQAGLYIHDLCMPHYIYSSHCLTRFIISLDQQHKRKITALDDVSFFLTKKVIIFLVFQ